MLSSLSREVETVNRRLIGVYRALAGPLACVALLRATLASSLPCHAREKAHPGAAGRGALGRRLWIPRARRVRGATHAVMLSLSCPRKRASRGGRAPNAGSRRLWNPVGACLSCVAGCDTCARALPSGNPLLPLREKVASRRDAG